jgi:hypothetical protein
VKTKKVDMNKGLFTKYVSLGGDRREGEWEVSKRKREDQGRQTM